MSEPTNVMCEMLATNINLWYKNQELEKRKRELKGVIYSKDYEIEELRKQNAGLQEENGMLRFSGVHLDRVARQSKTIRELKRLNGVRDCEIGVLIAERDRLKKRAETQLRAIQEYQDDSELLRQILKRM